MRVLQVNKFFYLRGGSERYFFDLCRLLEDRGHDVLHFSMQHERNRSSRQEPYFVGGIDHQRIVEAVTGDRGIAALTVAVEAVVGA